MKVRRQRRVIRGRIPRNAGLIPEIEQELRAFARRMNVTLPMVISTALADYFDFRLEAIDRADKPLEKLRKVK